MVTMQKMTMEETTVEAIAMSEPMEVGVRGYQDHVDRVVQIAPVDSANDGGLALQLQFAKELLTMSFSVTILRYDH